MNFKDYLVKDLDVFINLEEFAEIHDINGKQVSCIIDSDILNERSNTSLERLPDAEGVYQSSLVMFIKMSDILRPPIGAVMKVDGNIFLVSQVSEANGLYEITLEANET